MTDDGRCDNQFRILNRFRPDDMHIARPATAPTLPLRIGDCQAVFTGETGYATSAAALGIAPTTAVLLRRRVNFAATVYNVK